MSPPFHHILSSNENSGTFHTKTFKTCNDTTTLNCTCGKNWMCYIYQLLTWGQHHMPWSRISVLKGTVYSSYPWHFSTYGVIRHKLAKFKIKFVSNKHRAYPVYGKLFYMLMLSGPRPTPHQLSNTKGYLFVCLGLMILPEAYTPAKLSWEWRHPKLLRWKY